MEARGYDPMNISGQFEEIANLKRQDALKKVERTKKEMEGKNNIFLSNSKKSAEKSTWKHLKHLHRDSNLKEFYLRNLFITSCKRLKNLKELLCPSKLLKKKQGIISKDKSFIKYECKEYKACERINPYGKFT